MDPFAGLRGEDTATDMEESVEDEFDFGVIEVTLSPRFCEDDDVDAGDEADDGTPCGMTVAAVAGSGGTAILLFLLPLRL